MKTIVPYLSVTVKVDGKGLKDDAITKKNNTNEKDKYLGELVRLTDEA